MGDNRKGEVWVFVKNFKQLILFCLTFDFSNFDLLLANLESAYSLNWRANEIWEQGAGENLALL